MKISGGKNSVHGFNRISRFAGKEVYKLIRLYANGLIWLNRGCYEQSNKPINYQHINPSTN